jgi:hypothetical protein
MILVTTNQSIKSERIVSFDEAAKEMAPMLEASTYKSNIRSSFYDRQKREKILLQALYQDMPVGVEVKFMRASRVASKLGVATSFVDSAVRTFESMGILVRRLEFGAKDASGKVITGRSYHWSLLVSKEAALIRLEKYHEKEREAAEKKAPTVKTTSLKVRILGALETTDRFDTMEDLLKVIRRNGENIDFHNMKHVMESLVREGKITFEHGSTNDHIPLNIRLTKHATKATKAAPAPVEVDKNGMPNPFVEEPPTVVVKSRVEFPLIMKLLGRRGWLEQAASLAEIAGEEDLAITLLERTNKPFSAFEEEVVALFEAYVLCKGK